MTLPQALHFPGGFVFGAATSAYQIEGAVMGDGRGESIWDRFVATPGKIRHGNTGAMAADHYHRYGQDILLMHDLGLPAYRFSIAWPRIFPDGVGAINQKGLDFYDRLVDTLLEHHIEPFATLYHWDLPQTLEDGGGWPEPDVIEPFLRYTEAVVRVLGDRVRFWATLNEPWCTTWLGYGMGLHAPGKRDQRLAVRAAHHLLVAHGKAVDVIRRNAPSAQVGVVLNLYPIYPASDSVADMAAAREMDGVDNRWFLDPVFQGRYPELATPLAQLLPEHAHQDIAVAAAPIDFLGVNYYSRHIVRAPNDGARLWEVVQPRDGTYTVMGEDWEIYPQGLTDILTRVHHDYGPSSLYVMENGAAFEDVRKPDGNIDDPQRLQYLEAHLKAARCAIDGGVPLHGYFVWSLLDNFEWHSGYDYRFGIVYVDFETQQRVIKASGRWYRDVIAQQSSVWERHEQWR